MASKETQTDNSKMLNLPTQKDDLQSHKRQGSKQLFASMVPQVAADNGSFIDGDQN